jgi:N-glycosylase/DNA lyase
MNGDERIVFKNIKDFDPRHVFTCGQAFRWDRESDGSYTGVAGGRAACLAFTPAASEEYAGDIAIKPLGSTGSAAPCANENDRNFWEDYLDLRRDYGAVKRALVEGDSVMARAVAYGAGIRILRQEVWETLISFIISQNNNIARIKGCVKRLCEHFGARIARADGGALFAFPSAETLAALSAEDLAVCGLGYRTKYVCSAARRVAELGGEAWLAGLRGAPLAEAREAVLSFRGVGPKVADCILLFGLGRIESFPVDVWTGRAMRSFYGTGEKGAAVSAAARFGPYAGIAQQYLFYYMRENAAQAENGASAARPGASRSAPGRLVRR